MTETAKRFWTLIKLDSTSSGDVERWQLFYVIARTDALWNVCKLIYDTENHGLVDGCYDLLDGSYGKMLQRAVHTYNSCYEDVSTEYLFRSLDSYNSETMVNAQAIYSGIYNDAIMQQLGFRDNESPYDEDAFE